MILFMEGKSEKLFIEDGAVIAAIIVLIQLTKSLSFSYEYLTRLYSEKVLWEALDYSGLKNYVSGLTEKLDSSITANGENLSVGQRQLLCLSRAILTKPKIIVMDEATASVDRESDQLIQQAIKKHFKSTTVISIAHRLNTIADFDKVLVLDHGEMVPSDITEESKFLLCANGGSDWKEQYAGYY
ncbi:Multidrug resistance-associated protein 1 [Boothiomyces sp. JEL0866]|nr:Multidrug resistance-associated protein 1 [Boothiomyces sp. JEL0866]